LCLERSERNGYNYEKINCIGISFIGYTEDFIKLLRESGYKINSSTQKNKRFLSVNIAAININDDTICAYEYRNNQQMEEDLKTISSDGSMVGNAEVG
jgi:hypothetical protein